MFGSTARGATPQPGRADERAASRGRHHHRAARDREVRAREDAVRRARRRTDQVDAWAAASGPVPTASAAQRSPTRPEPVGPPRIDNGIARRDPLTRPFPAAPGLPDARRSPSAPLRAPAHAGGRF